MNLSESLRKAIEHHQAGKLRNAGEIYRQILARQPDNAEALRLLGDVLEAARRLPEAIDVYQRAAALRPEHGVYNNLGIALHKLRKLQEAIAAYREGLKLDQSAAGTWSNLGRALRELGRMDEAIEAFQRSAALGATHFPALLELGAALRQRGELEEAEQWLIKALEVNPKSADALNQLGVTLMGLGKRQEAIAAWRKAIASDPNKAEAHFNLGMALLMLGQFAEGWKEYEWRLKHTALRPRKFAQPRWGGEDLGGRRILVHAEQGLGDTIQFIRYMPMVAARGGRVIVECQAELTALIRGVAGVEQVVAAGGALPPFEVHVPLLSLPGVFATTPQTIPAEVPYIAPDRALVERWRGRISADAAIVKIGLVWAGKRSHANDPHRSIPLEVLAPMGAVARVKFFGLQKDEPICDVTGLPITQLSGQLGDLSETAAAIANLDLVISVDTSVAHLAGAMGSPVWVMLPFAGDWRWGIEGERTAWYPTMRLFRQSTPADWKSVVDRLIEELATRRGR